jgi:hypothetical protein
MSTVGRRQRREARKRRQGKTSDADLPLVGVSIVVPPGIFPWERELLAAHAQALLNAVLEGIAANGDED